MQPSRSLLSSTLFALALSTACGQPQSAKEPPQKTAADAKAKPVSEESKPASASERSEPELVERVEIDRPVDAKLAKTLANEGLEVTKGIEDALAAVEAGNEADVKAALARARKGLDGLEADRPTVDITVEVWRKGKELEAAELQGTVDTVPLLAEVMRLNVPVFDAKEIEARHAARKEQAPASVTAKDKTTDLEIIDANLVYEEIDLPIATTKIDVLAAEKLVAEGKLAEAGDVLRRALASIEVLELVEQAPEYRARQLVWDAKRAFVSGNMEETKRLLAQANELLEPLCEAKPDSQSQPDPQAQKLARMLLDELAPLRDVLAAGDAGQLDLLRRVEQDSMILARRTALRIMMASHREQERFALADALMWLERARTEGLLESKEGAGVNLVLAEAMLEAAAEQSPPSAKPRLDDLHARIQHLIALDEAKPRDAAQIASEYRAVTFALRMLMLDLGFVPVPTHG